MGGESRAQIVLPRLYVILDAETLERLRFDLVATALELRDVGVRLFQYRDKRGDAGAVLREARRLAECLEGSGCLLILNDYADLVGPSGCGGLHVGQGDVGGFEAREMVGEGCVLGVSTHKEAQVKGAGCGAADYVAIGPVYRTSTKGDAETAVGVEGVRMARGLTRKPLVGIGGISVERVEAVMEAGADAVAVIGALYRPGRSVGANARELLRAVAEG